MTNLIRPGLMFKAFPLPYSSQNTLEPTVSTYSYGDRLEDRPKKDDVYVICKDGSVQSRIEPDRPIGWELLELDNSWAYRVTQMNHKPKPLAVSFYGWASDIPEGYTTPPPTPRGAPECPDAPLKAIYEFDEKLGHCAQIINDQVQTEAMAKFVQGEMSYAEMRGLCG
jgi:hypothetical protein